MCGISNAPNGSEDYLVSDDLLSVGDIEVMTKILITLRRTTLFSYCLCVDSFL